MHEPAAYSLLGQVVYIPKMHCFFRPQNFRGPKIVHPHGDWTIIFVRSLKSEELFHTALNTVIGKRISSLEIFPVRRSPFPLQGVRNVKKCETIETI